MSYPIQTQLEPGEQIELRPYAKFRSISTGKKYRAGAVLTNRAFYICEPRTDSVKVWMPLSNLLTVERVKSEIKLMFGAPDGGAPIGAVFRIRPRTTAKIFVHYLLQAYTGLTGKVIDARQTD